MLNKLITNNKMIVSFFSIIFICLNLFFLANGKYFFAFLPIVFLIILLFLSSVETIFFIIAFFTPLSLGLRFFFPELSVDLSLPTEPLLAGLLLFIFYRFFIDQSLKKSIFLNSVTIAIIFYMFWMLITSISSSMPLVSIKYLIAHIWFIIPVYFLGIVLFQNSLNIRKFILLFSLSLSLIVIYTLYRYFNIDFINQKPSHFAVVPFFNDHTSYGAVLAMFIPPLFSFLFIKQLSKYDKSLFLFLTVFFIVALIFSFCRAAWISLFFAMIILVIVLLKIKLRYLIFISVICSIIFYLYQEKIFNLLERNRIESSADIRVHLKSITNINNDASNMERINRWKCAFEMFSERPVLGFGPGTYMFQYAPYQKYEDRTIISTDFGDWGNAHSEYIGPLAESGILGLLSFLILVIIILKTGFDNYKYIQNWNLKVLSLGIVLGLTTYFVHGLLNNFLDSDKLAVPFWSFVAMLIGLKQSRNKLKNQKQ